MTERKRSKREERSYAALVAELGQLESWTAAETLKRRLIPAEWHGLDRTAPVKPRKTRVTAGFDADLVRWFRAMGQGHQARMNAVLRAYMLAVLSREIEGTGDRDWKGDPL